MTALPLLTLLIALPLAGALCLAILPGEERGQQRALALVFMLLTFAVALAAAAAFDPAPSAPEFQLQTRLAWIPTLGISYHVGVDGLALVLVVLTGILGPLAVLSTFEGIRERVKESLIALLVLQAAMMGAFVALDLVLFYIFWEAMLVPMVLLIGIWGSDRRIYAAVKFFLYTMAGSLLMLVAILYVYFAATGPGGTRGFDYPELVRLAPALPLAAQRWLFLAFALSFAIKVPMVPLHTWLPDAHTEAPVAGSVILAGVLLKMGAFGFLRYAFPLFPDGALFFRPLLALLAVVGIVYGALMCFPQRDMKRLVAYSSVSHMGFVMLGLAALTPASLSGGVYQLLSHGVTTGALFLLVGMLYERRHTREIADYGGLAKAVPALATLFLLVTLASLGLPGTNGFIGEFLILAGSWSSKLANAPWYAAGGALGIILGAVYLLTLYQRIFFGPLRREENRRLKDLSLREWAILTPLALLIVAMGIHPQPILERIEPSVARLVQRVGAHHPELVGAPPASHPSGDAMGAPQGAGLTPGAPLPLRRLRALSPEVMQLLRRRGATSP